MERRLIETADGSKTLFIPEMNEQYHSVNGALTESNYVFLQQGYLAHPARSLTVFEVGFGTGLNALVTALEANKLKKRTRFVSIEKYPVTPGEISELNYGSLFSEEASQLFLQMHNAEWNQEVEISEYFSLQKINGDLTKYDFDEALKIDVVYFDAFGPEKQPDMWQNDIFLKIYNACRHDALFVTYSAKGEIRRNLAACGFEMARLPGPPGKRQMLRGVKK
ncbi:tRNA (5-methylaminomethyl-2-thiouridine)(34)-methyltransferase MnmD [Maribellus sp. YY47]|uniref:tRNA (5-methylaminomethyl-2-thiouridine)(34)-methyltransferase MnmD n=1 Tax=Maribellus sp. YY47 TaxID=2929486 RepID=UPI002000DE22|nr:tRNA (5-methylaminomethyl-2-thiouridine)(34)-methyltransferase MnmD [Maribellus sp. YY47]MCK3685647.1 tRNA (5-methylaminomethyl-2-thiouridine)(34)-methyltransferase MnmD [Maribellus sp. YY47]